MYRHITKDLDKWVNDQSRKPLILRGARQVGKTFAVRQLSTQFSSYIEVNCEEQEAACQLIFGKDLDPKRIIVELSLLTGQTIKPGETLLFIDEIQKIPEAIIALRYFYEKMPDLHVIAAGSLLEFALEKVGFPVGRVNSLYVYPLSFIEFLYAQEENLLVDAIFDHGFNKPMPPVIHAKLLRFLGEYFALGGMPEVVYTWITSRDPNACFAVQQNLIANYRQDFEKYAKNHQIKYVDVLFQTIPKQLGEKFQFSKVPGEYRKRDLAPALDLLMKAGIVHQVKNTSAQGLPLGAEGNWDKYKLVFVDIGLAQALLGLDLKEWFLDPQNVFVNHGHLVETFVGQELLAYMTSFVKHDLYYWGRDERSSSAEIDYVLQIARDIVPVEVKSGKNGKLKSLTLYMESHTNFKYAIKFSSQNFSQNATLHIYPLYAIASAIGKQDQLS